ncbi:MAG: hypothetical protein V7K21_27375 [Nostoc sp.]|uniref:hypothetical protein n=1 Tax=Nostoc sp. TaxID=1180 RepID=UPI002FF5205D
MTPVRSSRDTLSAVLPGGNPHRPWRLPLGEDRTASPHGWLLHLGKPLQPYGHPTAGASLSLWEKTALPPQCPILNLTI